MGLGGKWGGWGPPQGYPDQPDRNPRVELGRGAEATGGGHTGGSPGIRGSPPPFPPSPRGEVFWGGGCGSRVICAEMSGACAGPPRPGRRHRGGGGPGTRVGWGEHTNVGAHTQVPSAHLGGGGEHAWRGGTRESRASALLLGAGGATRFRTCHARESLSRRRPLSRCPHMSGVPTRIFRGERFAYRYPQGGGTWGVPTGTWWHPRGIPNGCGGAPGRTWALPGRPPTRAAWAVFGRPGPPAGAAEGGSQGGSQ